MKKVNCYMKNLKKLMNKRNKEIKMLFNKLK